MLFRREQFLKKSMEPHKIKAQWQEKEQHMGNYKQYGVCLWILAEKGKGEAEEAAMGQITES